MIRHPKHNQISKYKFDVKAGLEFYLPTLYNLIEEPFKWSQLDKLWHKQFEKNNKRFEDGPFQYGINIFQISVYAVEKGDESSIRYLDMLNQLFTALAQLLTKPERQMLRGNLFDLLRYSEDFRNYLGEFLILFVLLKNRRYKFVCSEYGVKKGAPTIDFKMLNMESGLPEYFEVINIIMNESQFVSHQETEQFLRSKIEPKILNKNKSGLHYVLVPVVWIGYDEWCKLVRFYQDTNFGIEGVSMPFVHSRFDVDNEKFDKFSSLVEAYSID